MLELKLIIITYKISSTGHAKLIFINQHKLCGFTHLLYLWSSIDELLEHSAQQQGSEDHYLETNCQVTNLEWTNNVTIFS